MKQFAATEAGVLAPAFFWYSPFLLFPVLFGKTMTREPAMVLPRRY